MKKKSTSQSAFFNLRILFVVALGVVGVAWTLFGSGALSGPTTRAKGASQSQSGAGSHKLSIRDRQLVESLKDRGAQCRC